MTTENLVQMWILIGVLSATAVGWLVVYLVDLRRHIAAVEERAARIERIAYSHIDLLVDKVRELDRKEYKREGSD
jgi:hypothetical protein